MSSKLDMRFTEAQRKEFRQRAEKMGKCFTAEEQEAFRKRAEILGEDRIAQVEHEWPELIAQVRAAMDASIPPTDPAVVEMGRRWHVLIKSFTGNDPTINRKISEAYKQEQEIMAAQGMTPEMLRYVGEAMAAAGLSIHM